MRQVQKISKSPPKTGKSKDPAICWGHREGTADQEEQIKKNSSAKEEAGVLNFPASSTRKSFSAEAGIDPVDVVAVDPVVRRINLQPDLLHAGIQRNVEVPDVDRRIAQKR